MTTQKPSGSGTGTTLKLATEGELPCLLVFSDVKHVDYINMLLSLLEAELRGNGFKPQRLGDEIRTGQDYLAKFHGMAEDCVLGVVILDGLRPNVPFEMGYLLGAGKPVIILQSKGATIALKSLYRSRNDADLGEKSWKTLASPSLEPGWHLSDYAGKHVGCMDRQARESDPEHPAAVLRKELDGKQDEVIEESKRVRARGLPAALPQEAVQELLEPMVAITRQYLAPGHSIDLAALQQAYQSATTVAAKHRVEVPAEVYRMVAGAYVSRPEAVRADAVTATACYDAAIGIYREMLSSPAVMGDPKALADARVRLASALYELSTYREPRENRREAIAAYGEALKVYTLQAFPMDYAMTQNNLGNAYGTLAEVEETAENCRRAIAAYGEALKVYTLQVFPMDYAMTQNNLGNAYRILAEVEEKTENCRRAIAAYGEALKTYTPGEFPPPARHDPEQPGHRLWDLGPGGGEGGELPPRHRRLRRGPEGLHSPGLPYGLRDDPK